MNLFTPAWWEYAAARAANTAIAALIPLATLLVAREVTPLYVVGVAAASALASFVTSLAGLPEVDGKAVPLWRAVLVRSAKTFGQVGAPMLLGVVVIGDVDWYAFLVTTGGAVLVTLLRTLKDWLPEQTPTGDTGLPPGRAPDPVDVEDAVLDALDTAQQAGELDGPDVSLIDVTTRVRASLAARGIIPSA